MNGLCDFGTHGCGHWARPLPRGVCCFAGHASHKNDLYRAHVCLASLSENERITMMIHIITLIDPQLASVFTQLCTCACAVDSRVVSFPPARAVKHAPCSCAHRTMHDEICVNVFGFGVSARLAELRRAHLARAATPKCAPSRAATCPPRSSRHA